MRVSKYLCRACVPISKNYNQTIESYAQVAARDKVVVGGCIAATRPMSVEAEHAVRGSTRESPCWTTHRPRYRTSHWTSVYPVSSIQGVERGWSLSRCVDARTPWWNHAIRWLRMWDERRQSRDKRAVVPHRLVRDSATLAVRNLSVPSMLLDMLTDGEIVSNSYTQHLQGGATRDSWQWWRFIDVPPPPSPSVGKKNFGWFVTVET